jgi:hypothetical protein
LANAPFRAIKRDTSPKPPGALTAIDAPHKEDLMKVSELIEILSDCDPEASVFVMSQENWPFECGLAGVNVREEFAEGEQSANGCAANDVFLVEGPQLRYGSRAAWANPTTA